MNDFDKKRYEYNKKILAVLADYIEKHPELRFTQILWGLKLIDNETVALDEFELAVKKKICIKDRYYEEPWDTLERIEQ